MAHALPIAVHHDSRIEGATAQTNLSNNRKMFCFARDDILGRALNFIIQIISTVNVVR